MCHLFGYTAHAVLRLGKGLNRQQNHYPTGGPQNQMCERYRTLSAQRRLNDVQPPDGGQPVLACDPTSGLLSSLTEPGHRLLSFQHGINGRKVPEPWAPNVPARDHRRCRCRRKRMAGVPLLPLRAANAGGVASGRARAPAWHGTHSSPTREIRGCIRTFGDGECVPRRPRTLAHRPLVGRA